MTSQRIHRVFNVCHEHEQCAPIKCTSVGVRVWVYNHRGAVYARPWRLDLRPSGLDTGLKDGEN